MRILFLFFLLLPQLVFCFPKFKSEAKYYDAATEREYIYLRDEIEEFSKNPALKNQLKKKIQQNIEVENHFYANRFISLLVRYSFMKEDYATIIQLYDLSLLEEHIDSYISYAELLDEFYSFFYQYDIISECNFINKKVESLQNKGTGAEKEYLTFILNKIEDLRMTDESLQVKHKNITENLSLLENLEKQLDRSSYERKLATQYNLLAISYYNAFEQSNLLPQESKDLAHAISLLKKALRINADKNKYMSIIINSNLTFVLNKAGEYEEALKYGLKSNRLLITMDTNHLLNAKVVCNLHDLYECLNDMDQYYRLHETCKKSQQEYLEQKINVKEKVTQYLKSNKRKVKNSFIGNHLLFIGAGIAFLFIGLFYIGFKRTTKKPKNL